MLPVRALRQATLSGRFTSPFVPIALGRSITTRSTSSPSAQPTSSLNPSPHSSPSAPTRTRSYASHSTFNPPPSLNPYSIFHDPSKSRQRLRALLRLREQGHEPSLVDYVREEIAERLSERMEDLKEKPGRVLEVSGHKGELTRVLQEVLGDELDDGMDKVVDSTTGKVGKRGKREWVVMEDSEAVHADEFDCECALWSCVVDCSTCGSEGQDASSGCVG